MRSASPTLRSRRLALVAAAVVLGVSACGSDPARQSVGSSADPDATTVTTVAPPSTSPAETLPADGPQPIRVGDASTGGPAVPLAEDSIAEGGMSEDTKMMATDVQFVLDVVDPPLPDLTEPATAWFFPAQPAAVADERVAEMAAVLGVEGPVEPVEEELGGGRRIGADDFTRPSFTVGVDALQTWWYSAGDAAMSSPVCEVSSNEAPPDSNPPADSDAPLGSEPVPVEEPRPDCIPQPPAGVPSAAEAEAATTELMTLLGYDPTSYEFETYADDWGASVNAYLLLEGVRSNVSMYFSFGGEATLSWAGGFLASPERGEDYPRIGVTAAVERLNAPNWLMGDVLATDLPAIDTKAVETEPVPDTGVQVEGESAPAEPIEPVETLVADVPVEIDPMPCDVTADCIPTSVEPLVIHISDPQPSLEQLWADDGTVWLLPGYTFAGEDEGVYSVIAVEAAYLLTGDDEPSPDPTVDSVPLPDTAPPATATPGSSAAPTDSTAPQPPQTTLVFPNPADYTGLPLEESAKVVEQFGWVMRVVREDGVDLAVTADFVEHRLNVAVEDGIVTELVSTG